MLVTLGELQASQPQEEAVTPAQPAEGKLTPEQHASMANELEEIERGNKEDEQSLLYLDEVRKAAMEIKGEAARLKERQDALARLKAEVRALKTGTRSTGMAGGAQKWYSGTLSKISTAAGFGDWSRMLFDVMSATPNASGKTPEQFLSNWELVAAGKRLLGSAISHKGTLEAATAALDAMAEDVRCKATAGCVSRVPPQVSSSEWRPVSALESARNAVFSQERYEETKEEATAYYKKKKAKRKAGRIDVKKLAVGFVAGGPLAIFMALDPKLSKKVMGKTFYGIMSGIYGSVTNLLTGETVQLTVRLLKAKRKDRKKLRQKLKGSLTSDIGLVLTVASLASSIVTGPVGIALALSINAMQAGMTVALALEAAKQTKKAAKDAKKIAQAEITKIEAEEKVALAEIARLKADLASARQQRVARTSAPGRPGSSGPVSAPVLARAASSLGVSQTTMVLGGLALIGGGIVAWSYLGDSDQPDAP